MGDVAAVTIEAEPELIDKLLASLSLDYKVLLRLDGRRPPAAGKCDMLTCSEPFD
jgi:hypothetical protein